MTRHHRTGIFVVKFDSSVTRDAGVRMGSCVFFFFYPVNSNGFAALRFLFVKAFLVKAPYDVTNLHVQRWLNVGAFGIPCSDVGCDRVGAECAADVTEKSRGKRFWGRRGLLERRVFGLHAPCRWKNYDAFLLMQFVMTGTFPCRISWILALLRFLCVMIWILNLKPNWYKHVSNEKCLVLSRNCTVYKIVSKTFWYSFIAWNDEILNLRFHCYQINCHKILHICSYFCHLINMIYKNLPSTYIKLIFFLMNMRRWNLK